MASHVVWKTWPSVLSIDKYLGLWPRFSSTEALEHVFDTAWETMIKSYNKFSLCHDVNEVIKSTTDVSWLLIGQCEWCHFISHRCLMTSHWPMWLMSYNQPQMSHDFSVTNVNDVILSATDVQWLLIGQCEWCHLISHRCLITSHWPMWMMSSYQP